MRPKPFPNSAEGMAAPASRAPISLQSAFPARPQVIPNQKLHWRSSSKPASDLCVLVCTHEAGFLSRDDAAPTGLLVCQNQRRHRLWHRHTSPPKASARRQRPMATSHGSRTTARILLRTGLCLRFSASSFWLACQVLVSLSWHDHESPSGTAVYTVYAGAAERHRAGRKKDSEAEDFPMRHGDVVGGFLRGRGSLSIHA